MTPKELRLWLWLMVFLIAAGGWLLRLCGRFSGFRHPLTLPTVLGGVCVCAAVLLLVLYRK